MNWCRRLTYALIAAVTVHAIMQCGSQYFQTEAGSWERTGWGLLALFILAAYSQFMEDSTKWCK